MTIKSFELFSFFFFEVFQLINEKEASADEENFFYSLFIFFD